MPGAAFRMFFGARPATLDELGRVEEIVVEQEMEMAWQARIRMVLCLDDQGHWRNQAGEVAAAFTRVRVELRLGAGAFVPLIDGPVAGFESAMSASPGQSTVSLVVRDDSVLMNREEDTEVFESRADDAVAREVFGRFDAFIRDVRTRPAGGQEPVTVRRGTAIQFLRELARVHGYLAYVLPGAEPGASVGCFLPPATEPDGLPPLKLLGEDRTLIEATVEEDSEGPERTRGRTLRISDQQIVSSRRSIRDQELMGALPAVPDDQSALRELPPEQAAREDPEAAVQGQNRRAAYGFRLAARVVPGCYEGVLAPYRVVTILAGDLPHSGDWLIRKVTHRISPSVYTQEFAASRDARSDTSGAAGLASASGVI